jgi:hypothetical protein
MEPSKMKFTGTMIEDLMATVERAERRSQSDEASLITYQLVESSAAEPFSAEQFSAETLPVEAWFASTQENPDHDSKLMGAA